LGVAFRTVVLTGLRVDCARRPRLHSHCWVHNPRLIGVYQVHLQHAMNVLLRRLCMHRHTTTPGVGGENGVKWRTGRYRIQSDIGHRRGSRQQGTSLHATSASVDPIPVGSSLRRRSRACVLVESCDVSRVGLEHSLGLGTAGSELGQSWVRAGLRSVLRLDQCGRATVERDRTMVGGLQRSGGRELS